MAWNERGVYVCLGARERQEEVGEKKEYRVWVRGCKEEGRHIKGLVNN